MNKIAVTQQLRKIINKMGLFQLWSGITNLVTPMNLKRMAYLFSFKDGTDFGTGAFQEVLAAEITRPVIK